MKLTDEAKAFHHGVYAIVKGIPYGKVTSYGHIAYLLGRPQNSRQVGSSLKHCNEIVRLLNQDSRDRELELDLIDITQLPWWRVISSSGKISPRGNHQGEIDQKNHLTREGIEVNGTLVDIDEFGWYPEDVEF